MTATSKQHLAILDILRAVAALTVCLFHFNHRDGSPLAYALEYGHYGVEVFFVISGFIIPLAMFWSKFTYRDSGHFLIRRGIRLYPVFALVALVHLVFSAYGCAWLGYGGGSPDLTWTRALANFTLSCNLVGQDWYLPVFWTLAIEAQYYLCIVATFPLLVHRNQWVKLAALLLWIVPTYFVGYGETVFTWTAFFAFGILAFLKKQGLLGQRLFWILLILAAIAHHESRNLVSTWIGLATTLLIVYAPSIRSKVFERIGVVSYSLYLLHLIFGSAALILLRQLPDSWQWPPLNILIATLISLASALVFYKYLEQPFHQWARAFKTKAREKEIQEKG